MEEIEKLKEKRTKLYNEIHKISNQIKKLEIAENNYIGKYIYIYSYGYMYVCNQYFVDGDDNMILSGITFNINNSYYMDDFYFEGDAMKRWEIPSLLFRDFVEGGDIEVIDRDEFIKKFNEESSKWISNFISMLEIRENDLSVKENNNE